MFNWLTCFICTAYCPLLPFFFDPFCVSSSLSHSLLYRSRASPLELNSSVRPRLIVSSFNPSSLFCSNFLCLLIIGINPVCSSSSCESFLNSLDTLGWFQGLFLFICSWSRCLSLAITRLPCKYSSIKGLFTKLVNEWCSCFANICITRRRLLDSNSTPKAEKLVRAGLRLK